MRVFYMPIVAFFDHYPVIPPPVPERYDYAAPNRAGAPDISDKGAIGTMTENLNGKAKRGSSFWKKATAATLAAGMLVGGASGVYADGKDKNDSKHGAKHAAKQEAKDAKASQGKVKIEFNLDFRDLNERDWKWAYEHIIRLASKQVFNGYADGSFKPRNNISRIEAIVAAVRLLGLKEEAEKPENRNATLNFKDFKQVQKKYPWAVGYLKVALKNDLFEESDAFVQPDKAADRLWSSILLVKALKLEDEAKANMDAELKFRDADQIPAASVGYVAVAVEKGLITGYDDNTFRPNKPVTRAELAALLDRADEQLPDQGATAITGSVQSVSGSTLKVKPSGGTVVTLTLASNVFVFRDGDRVSASALKAGDEVLVRTYEGKVVFIEVKKESEEDRSTDSGKVGTITLNAEGKIATLSLVKTVNGVTGSVVYNVSDDVEIAGDEGELSPNRNVVVTIENNVVTRIDVQS